MDNNIEKRKLHRIASENPTSENPIGMNPSGAAPAGASPAGGNIAGGNPADAAQKKPSEAARRAADIAMQHQQARIQEDLNRAQSKKVAGQTAYEQTAPEQATLEQAEAEQGEPSRKPPKKPKKQKKKTGKAGRVVLFCLLGLLLVGGGVLAKFYHDISTNPVSVFPEITPVPTPVPTPAATLAPDVTATPEPTPDPAAVLLSEADLEFMKNRVNIMVLGLDESAERASWGAFRTDTMILVTIDFDTNDITMISCPRDSYVKLANGEGHPIKNGENFEFAKINSAFPKGGGSKKNGYAYAMGTVSYVLGGIPIQYYVGFNMNVVKDMVNAMGGLYYDVDTKVTMNGREYEPGYQYMDGQAVLDYCRQRKGSSDIARVERQQNMLKAIFREMKSTGQIVNIPKIYKAVETNIETNLSFAQISALALIALHMDADQLQSRTLDGTFLNMRSTSYWGLYTGKIASMVKEVFGISVNIDGDLNVTNIKAVLEANRQLIAAELNAAKSAINIAQGILKDYGNWLTEEAKNRLKSALSQCEDAYDAEDKALLDYYTPPLQSLNNEMLASLQQAGVITSGQVASQQGQQQYPEVPEIPEIPVINNP